jgi:hypothetical protein
MNTYVQQHPDLAPLFFLQGILSRHQATPTVGVIFGILHLRQGGGEIRATLFGVAVDKFYHLIEEGQVSIHRINRARKQS